MTTPAQETMRSTLSDHAFTVIVFFRGHWCPFCRAWLKELETLRDSINKRGGTTLAITAEEESKQSEMHRLSGYSGQIISDPENSVASFFRQQGWVDVAITPKAGYPNGMAQPAIVILTKERSNLYNWAIVPSTMNLGGAKDRPNLAQVMDNVFAKLEGRGEVHKTIKLQTFWQGISSQLFGVKS